MKIKETLEKRTKDFYALTEEMLGHYEENLVRAIRFFTKTDKDIRVTNVYLYPKNNNFVVHTLKIDVKIGDKIRDTDGNVVVVDESNIDSVVTNELNVILPTIILEEGTALQMYEQLKYIDSFIKEHGEDKFYKVLASGISTFNEMLEEKHETLLEELTDPTDTILKSLDELQRVQYNLFLNDDERRLH